MVEASCRLIDSAVRHHNRLEAAAVSRIAVNTSAETANRMLTVSVRADGGRSRAKAFRGGTAFMLASAGLRRRLKAIRRARAGCYVVPAGPDHPREWELLLMPILPCFDSDKALEDSLGLPLFGPSAARQGDQRDI